MCPTRVVPLLHSKTLLATAAALLSFDRCVSSSGVLEQCHFSAGMAVACLQAGHKSLTDLGLLLDEGGLGVLVEA